MLHGLPSIEIMTYTDPDVERLVDVLTVATAHKVLVPRYERRRGPGDENPCRAAKQTRDALPGALQSGRATRDARGRVHTACGGRHCHAVIRSGRDQGPSESSDANASAFHHRTGPYSGDGRAAGRAAQDADPAADGEGSDGESAFAAGFISDFVSGEAPKDQRTGWDVRGDRNRAALNQNFARELPLEYRGLLKNYYERVAK